MIGVVVMVLGGSKSWILRYIITVIYDPLPDKGALSERDKWVLAYTFHTEMGTWSGAV